jgi:amidophosphoribosyltransferase
MGINIPTRDELVANKYPSMEELAAYFGADSLAYLSLDGLVSAVKEGAATTDPDAAHCTGTLAHVGRIKQGCLKEGQDIASSTTHS